MYKQLIALTLLTLVASGYAQVVGWTDCGSTATIRHIIAGPCLETPCHFGRNNTYRIELHATSTELTNSIPFSVSATILGLPWTILEGNACDQLSCPVPVGTEFYFGFDYTVSEIFPPVPTTVSTLASNHLGNTILCFTMPIQIT